MFWKKDKSPIFIELNTTNQRHTYRVTPSKSTSIALLVNGERGHILNISTRGVAFILEDACDPLLAVGQKVQGALILGGPKRHPIAIELEIIEQQGNRFRSRLTPSSAKAERDLCRYVIAHQKQEIRGFDDKPAPSPSPHESHDETN